jgi:hypothetical protein
VTISGGSTPRRAAPDDEVLERPADDEQHRDDQGGAGERRDAGGHEDEHQEVRGQDDQIAVGEVDHAHRPEVDREAQADEAVQPAEQESIEQGLEQLHRQPK